MTPAELTRRADAHAMLLAQSFTLGMSTLAQSFSDPAVERPPNVWDKYVAEWTADVERKIAHAFDDPPPEGDSGSTQ